MLAQRLLAAPLLAVLLLAGCGRPARSSAEALPRGVWRTFEGDWSAAGTRTTLRLGPEHRAAIFHVSGSVLLVGESGLGVGFKAEAIGLSDSDAGVSARCVWTDERGDEIYSELSGDKLVAGNRVTGTITGGTGRFDGVTGDYVFQWQYVVDAEDGAFSGRAVGLAGRACIGPPPPGLPPELPSGPPSNPPSAPTSGPPSGDTRR